MGWSKSTRISLMLGIDIVFFLVELISGSIIGSLALIADAFHMLNDIISLIIGLWAVSVARKATTDKYSYGWLRAEILGAFFNAVFLIALCVSIVVQAIERFFNPEEIENPKVMLIVGSFGLASNLIGFAILGGHGHSHGGEGHDHDHDHAHEGEHEHDHGEHGEHAHSNADLRSAEEGRAAVTAADIADEEGRAYDVLPQVALARVASEGQHENRPRPQSWSTSPLGDNVQQSPKTKGRASRRSTSLRRHNRLTSIDDLSIHPASFRQEILQASRSQTQGTPGEPSTSESDAEDSDLNGESTAVEDTPLLADGANGASRGRSNSKGVRLESDLHRDHHHTRPKKSGSKGGHNHSDMGMNAMILHVLGDALGNVGVIATALVIWLTDWPLKNYADPAVSLFITLIIIQSALPLTIATAKVLLQATPDHIDVNEIREDVEHLPGVISCHHIHIWQLSDTQIVASMHIQVAFPISEANGEKYMELARRTRMCLHAHGIHSATIQPEFCLDPIHDHQTEAAELLDPQAAAGDLPKRRAEMCLLECVEDCDEEGCCSATEPSVVASSRRSSHSAHSPGHQH